MSDVTPNIYWHSPNITRTERERLNGHRGCAVWFTGLSGAGKSTLAHALEARLFERGCRTFVLDGDNVRHGLCADLGFSEPDRHENIRRIGEMTRLFVEAGMITLSAFISPYRADRLRFRERIGTDSFIEVHCRCSLEVCEQRDRKGIYRRARAGEIPDFTGISAPYEEPLTPDVALDTATTPVDECVAKLMKVLHSRGILVAA
ncbi:MAG: adenylyl-sulfate kinase [Betaproteobacteria bacterium]|nr:MAG: adenylyl-sulfate kinase [Betaproteobacteria bacterium]